MELILEMYQAKDGKLFQGALGTKEACRQYEIDLDLAPVRARLKKCNLVEQDISDNYNSTFKRRHNATLITATVYDRHQYLDLLYLVYYKYGEPKEVKEKELLYPSFPLEMNVVVHRGVKRSHAEIFQKEIVESFTNAEPDMDTAPTAPLKPLPTRGAVLTSDGKPRQQAIRSDAKRYSFKGNDLTLMEISAMSGISAGTLRSRLRLGWSMESAVSTPVRRATNPPTLPA